MSPRARKPYARARSSAIAEPPRVPEHRELGDVASEEERGRPVGHDAQLPREQGELVEVVAAGDEPADEAGQPRTGDVGDALVAAERGDLAEHPETGGGAPGRGIRWRGGGPPPGLFFASRRACRKACCDVGGSNSPGVARFGTRAASPSAQTLPCPSTRSVSSTVTRPRSSTGRPRRESAGFALTPAVQTRVCVGTSSPLERCATCWSTDSSVVPTLISIPRLASCCAA